MWRQNLTKFGELENKVLLKSFEKYSYQNVNIVVYIQSLKWAIFEFKFKNYKLAKIGDRLPPGEEQ